MKKISINLFMLLVFQNIVFFSFCQDDKDYSKVSQMYKDYFTRAVYNAEGAKNFVCGSYYKMDYFEGGAYYKAMKLPPMSGFPPPAWAFVANLDYNKLVSMFKELIYDKDNAKIRKAVIDGAYLQTFGRTSTIEEFNYWDSKISQEKVDYYATMVAANTAFINSNIMRRAVITHEAYKTVFGRQATSDEIQYWLNKTETYAELEAACINFIYSPGNENLVLEMIRLIPVPSARGKGFTDDQLKDILIYAKANRATFKQLVGKYKLAMKL